MADKLTRQEMAAVIRSGGSILYGGRIITAEDELPSEADLAGSPEEEQKVITDYETKIAELQAQVEKLQAKQEARKDVPKGKAKKGEPEEEVFEP